MAGPRIHPSRLQQMATGNGESYGRNHSWYGSMAKTDDGMSIAQTRSISPAASVVTTTAHTVQQIHNGRSVGIFVRGQALPLAFHVLAGPMQKVAEMTVTVRNLS